MEFWVALGIEATKDEDAINEAYRNKLQLVHPEEHPEEFMQLRQAYEEALAYARKKDEGENPHEQTPVDIWLKRVEEVYDELPRRLDPEEWKTLLADDICHGLDSRIDARDGLLRLCMECYIMPPAIWKIIVDSFSLRDCYDELCEKFPKDYIDNAVIGGADSERAVPLELFAEGTTGNPDPYISLFHKARRERREGNLEACAATVEDMKATGFEHPFTRLVSAELAAASNEKERGMEILDELAAQYPQCVEIRVMHGDFLRNIKKDYRTAISDFEFVLSKFPESNQARWGKAECLFELGELEDAKELYLRLHQSLAYDREITDRIDAVNKLLMEQYAKQIEENPDDFELRMNYAWSCLQHKEYDRAKALIEGVVPADLEQKCDFENFCTKLYMSCEEFETALEHSLEWKKSTDELPEGENEKEKKRKGKTPEILYLQAYIYHRLGNDEEALRKADESENDDPTSTDPINLKRLIFSRMHQYDRSVAEAEKVVKLDASYTSWYSLAYEQYLQGNKVAAYHSLEAANNYARVMESYDLRGRILCDLEEWEEVKKLIDFLTENGIPEDHDAIRYMRARIMHSDGQKQDALREYYALIEKCEADDSPIFYVWDLYYRAADIEDDENSDADKILALIEKGLARKEDYMPLLELKSYVTIRTDRYQDVVDTNRRILEFVPAHRAAYGRIANAFYDMDEYEAAVEYYLEQIRRDNSSMHEEMLAITLTYLKRYEEAEEHYLKSMELDTSRLRPYCNMGMMFERKSELERALPWLQKCVSMDEENGNKYEYARDRLAILLSRMGRYDEAIAVYHDIYKLFDKEEYARKEVELYMESGRYEEGEKLLKKYYDEGKCDYCYLEMMADFRLYRGKDKDFLKLVGKMEDGTKKSGKLGEYYFWNSDYIKAMQYYETISLEDLIGGGHLSDYIRLTRILGRRDDFSRALEQGLSDTEKMSKHAWRSALYLTRKALYLLAAGRTEEAKEYIDRAMTEPMCNHCRYSKCKDAYIALMEYYNDRGEYQKAMDTAREGAAFAPDTREFICMIKQLKKERKAK